MLIDWFTVAAQAINFIILVWLLKFFLYKPILTAIDAREQRIATELAAADAKKADAENERDEFQHKNEEFDKQRVALLKKATDAAETERQQLLDEARKAADVLRAKRETALRTERRGLNQAIRRWTQEQAFAVARKALADLAGSSLEERICDTFLQRLRSITGAPKDTLSEVLKSSPHPVAVRTAFDLSPEQRAAVQKAINETTSADIHLQFETVPELVSGIEVLSNGQKVGWSVDGYLANLERSASELLSNEERDAATPEPKPEEKTEEKTEPHVGAAA